MTEPLTERDKLIEELDSITDLDWHHEKYELPKIADFILDDRKRIVEPLVKLYNEHTKADIRIGMAILETLKLAGEL